MGGIYVQPVRARAVLVCDKCGERWQSAPYEPRRWGQENAVAAPAFSLGWRIFLAGRGHRTYCPDHGPSKPMRLLHGIAD